MKKTRRIAAMVAAMAMAATLAVPSVMMSASASDYQITITDATGTTADSYTAYRVFDLAYNADKTAYTYTVADNGFTEAQIKTASGQNSIEDTISWLSATDVSGTADEVAAAKATRARTFADALYKNGSLPSTTYTPSEGVIDTGTAGYFLVVGSSKVTGSNPEQAVTSAVMLTNADPTATVTPKLDYPTHTKEIKHNELNTWGVVGDNQIGDAVEYKITTTMPDPDYVAKFTTTPYVYTIHDDMSKGLTFNSNSVVIKIGDTTINPTKTVDESNLTIYTVNTTCTHTDADYTDESGFEIVFNMANLIKAYPTVATDGASIVTSYSCTLNEYALVASGANDQTNHNDNTSHLEYSNNPYVSENNTNDTPDVTVFDWTFYETVTKVDGSGTGLAGAEFQIYDTDPTGAGAKALTFTKSDEVYTIDPDGTTATTITSVATGGFTLKGLDDSKTYYVVETKTPDGYTGAGTKTFTITAGYDTAGSKLTSLADDVAADGANNLQIVNTSGNQLPSTGGMGTTLFVLGGGVTMAAAGIYLVSKKRSKDAE